LWAVTVSDNNTVFLLFAHVPEDVLEKNLSEKIWLDGLIQ